MVGALALDEELAGAVIGLMFTGGAALEAAASRRARRELTRWSSARRASRSCASATGSRRCRSTRVQPGDVVAGAHRRGRPGRRHRRQRRGGGRHQHAHRRAAAGDARPRHAGASAEPPTPAPPFDVRADRPAAESAYAALVRLVEQAADRSARRSCGWPTATPASSCRSRWSSPALAWALSGDPVRALAVVVVATPCPLILAAPIALVSGLSRAARSGVIVKGAGAIETLGRGAHGAVRQDRHAHRRHAGGARDRRARRLPPGEVLRLAASVDRLSAHVLGEALVHAAQRGRAARSTTPDGRRRGARPGHRRHGRRPPRRGRQPRVPARGRATTATRSPARRWRRAAAPARRTCSSASTARSPA